MKSLKLTQNKLLRAGYIRDTSVHTGDRHVWVDVTPANGSPIRFQSCGENVVGFFTGPQRFKSRPDIVGYSWCVDSLKKALYRSRSQNN